MSRGACTRMRVLLESGRPIQARPMMTAGFGVRPVPVMGQLWNPPGGGGAPTPQPAPAPGGAPGLDCYQCGNQGYRQMTASMAAMVPGGCTKVDPSFCAQATAPPSGGPGGFPQGGPGAGTTGACNPLAPQNCASTLEINVTVFRADNLHGAAGAKVKIELLEVSTFTGLPSGASSPVVEGMTDGNGKYIFAAAVPAPAMWHAFRITISSGPGISFPTKTADVQAYQPNNVKTVSSVFAVCPSGTDDVVCEVGEYQVKFTEIYNQQMGAWGQGGQQAAKDFAFKTAHFFIAQSAPRNGLLAKYWDWLSYGVCDLGIPPTDWPKLLANYDQVQKIWAEIPWPSDGKIKDLFKRCARGIPIFNTQPIVDIRLYAPTFTAYFPREDYKIRAEMACAYLLNIHLIFQCMVDKLIAAAKQMQKHLGQLALIRMTAAFIFAPLTGGAMLTTLVAEAGQYVASHYSDNKAVGDVKGIVAGAVKNVGVGAAAVGAGLFAAGAALILPEIVKGADPTVQTIANQFGPKVAEAAAKDVLQDVIGQGTVSGPGLLSVAGLGTAGATLAVEAMLSLITMKGAKDAKAFGKTVSGVTDFISRCATPDPDGQMCADIMPFVLWCVEAMLLDKFFDHVAEQAGITGVDTNTQVIQPAADQIEAQGVTVPSSATTSGGVPTPGATGSTIGGLAAVAGIGAGSVLALFLTGAFGRS